MTCSSLIPGLNIQLDTPELIAKWIAERKKRWPTAANTEKKALHTWDDPAKTAQRRFQARQERNDNVETGLPEMFRAPETIRVTSSSGNSKEALSKEGAGSDASGSSSEASSPASDDSDEESSGSDVDEERDVISSKVAPKETPAISMGVCRFFQRGHCKNEDDCKFSHDVERNTASLSQHQQGSASAKKRRRPRAASPNPFETPHLLRALLRNEIAQHVNYIAQVVRFLVRNSYLAEYERRAGDAAKQANQRNLIQEMPKQERPFAEICEDERTAVPEEKHTDGKKTSEIGPSAVAETASAPIVDGALPVVDNGLYEPRSPTLKPFEELALPPEPDEFALMDPLRAQDAQPMTHAQFRQIAQDDGVRALLTDSSALPARGGSRLGEANAEQTVAKGMARALQTLDALPSYAHRASAIEQILGVSEQSAHHAHQLGPTFVRPDRTASGSGAGSFTSSSSLAGQAGGPSRIIGENELFRLGLRVGPVEIQKLRQLASRISAVVGGPDFAEVDADGIGTDSDADAGALQPWWDEARRREMRKRKWAREADWRDQMRKLGVDVD